VRLSAGHGFRKEQSQDVTDQNVGFTFQCCTYFAQVCPRVPKPRLERDKVVYRNLLSHLPLRWLVTGESQVLDETPILFTDAFMILGSDHPTVWRKPYRDRPRYATRIETVFRAMNDGALVPSSVLTDMQAKGIQVQPVSDLQQVLNGTSLDNRPLTKVSNGRFRKLMYHSAPQTASNRPWQNLWTLEICHRDLTLWWRTMHAYVA
jgi:hypothetical protein